MAKYNITRGLYANYQPDTKHLNHIYFAIDRGIILVNGKVYGFDSENLFIENISYSAGIVTIYFSNDTSKDFVITKDDIGLSEVTNDAQVKRSEMGAPLGVPTLDESGKILPQYLEGVMNPVVGLQKFVDTRADLDSITPVPSDGRKYYSKAEDLIYTRIGNEDGSWNDGEKPKTNTIYNHREADSLGRTNVIYRWDGQTMIEISSSLVIGEVEGTAFEGNRGVKAEEDIDNLRERLRLFEEWNEG